MDYDTIRSASEFLKFMKGIYAPSRKEPEVLRLPAMRFLMIDGQGVPASKMFQDSVQALYSLLFQLKMGMKFGKIRKPDGWFDFKVPPLEGLWWTNKDVVRSRWKATQAFAPDDLISGHWTLMMLVPPFIPSETIKEAMEQASVKKPSLPITEIRCEEFTEGEAVQMMHIGPYSTEPETVRKLVEFAEQKGCRFTGKHHEVYLSDPRRTQGEKLRTILRYPLRKF
ncbi:MAG: GyrI-like domain-containing protein [Candidatus Peregrinibacteria bacterium]